MTLMRCFPTIALIFAFFVTHTYGQQIDWKSTGSFLPTGNYSLHISWDQQVYISHTNSGLIYKYLPIVSNWTPVITQPSTSITIISDSLAFGFDNTFGNYSIMFRLRNGWKTQDTIVADGFGRFDKMHVGADTTIYYSKGGHGSGIFRSTDVGITWDTVLHPDFLSESIRGSVPISTTHSMCRPKEISTEQPMEDRVGIRSTMGGPLILHSLFF